MDNTRIDMYLENIKAAANGDALPHALSPVWRVEHFLNNIVLAFQSGTLETLNAVTREEQWLQNIVDAIGNNALSFALSPAWRVEMWYQNIIDAIKGNELTYTLTPVWTTEAWYADIITTIQSQQPTSAVGEWLWNEEVTLPTSTHTYAVSISSFDANADPIQAGSLDVTKKLIKYGSEAVVYTAGMFWLNAASRSITITGGDDVENADFLAYLTANATRVG